MKPFNDMLSKLTNREKEVFICLTNGYQNKQIAFKLGIAEATVKAFITKIFKKLGVTNKTQIVSIIFKDFIKNIANNSFENPAEAAKQFLQRIESE